MAGPEKPGQVEVDWTESREGKQAVTCCDRGCCGDKQYLVTNMSHIMLYCHSIPFCITAEKACLDRKCFQEALLNGAALIALPYVASGVNVCVHLHLKTMNQLCCFCFSDHASC